VSLLLVRHGETAMNAARVLQYPHTPLGPNGLHQAARLAAHLAARTVGLVMSSDYVRARMTADPIAAACRVGLVESPLLRERNFGDIRGLPYAELGGFDIMGPDYEPPGGESWAVFHRRVDQAWEAILAHAVACRGALVVVTHGLVLRSLLERVLDASGFVLPPDLIIPNTAVTEVERTRPWRVCELANVAHLDRPAGEGAPV
jgi:2,3-bisphosphoglycerate-dependent phosphoglycerate mutase